jgi:hypothetical protein
VLEVVISNISDELKDRRDPQAAVERMAMLCPPMQSFINQVRAYEGLLSQAQITDAANLVPGTSNYVSHMIAKANHEYGICSSKQSMNASWYYMMKTLHEECVIAEPGPTVYSFPDFFQPASLKLESGAIDYQVIGFVFKGTPHVGVVSEVYRGAAVAPRGGVKPLGLPCSLIYLLWRSPPLLPARPSFQCSWGDAGHVNAFHPFPIKPSPTHTNLFQGSQPIPIIILSLCLHVQHTPTYSRATSPYL